MTTVENREVDRKEVGNANSKKGGRAMLMSDHTGFKSHCNT